MAGFGSGGTEPALIFPKRSRSDIRAVFSSCNALNCCLHPVWWGLFFAKQATQQTLLILCFGRFS
jgi:hypothetical protein